MRIGKRIDDALGGELHKERERKRVNPVNKIGRLKVGKKHNFPFILPLLLHG